MLGMHVGVHISFWRHEYTENYHVTLHCAQQTIVVLPAAFKRILGLNYNVEVGCREITLKEAVELGFIFPSTFSIIRQQDVI